MGVKKHLESDAPRHFIIIPSLIITQNPLRSQSVVAHVTNQKEKELATRNPTAANTKLIYRCRGPWLKLMSTNNPQGGRKINIIIKILDRQKIGSGHQVLPMESNYKNKSPSIQTRRPGSRMQEPGIQYPIIRSSGITHKKKYR